MRCEVCGRKIHGKLNNVIIEKAKLTVCNECAKLGKDTWEEPKPKLTALKPRATPVPLRTPSKKVSEPIVDTTQLVDGFEAKIRQAREKLGFTHEELGKRINEKVSLLRKIETGKMKPDNKLASRLEHALKVKLIVPSTEEKVPQTKMAKQTSRELTLGDLIQLNKESKNE